MAALLLARLLTRPDMAAALTDFLQWQQQALAAAAGPSTVFLLPGILQTLALIFKFGRREQLLPLAPQLWQQVAALLGDDSSSSSASSSLRGRDWAQRHASQAAAMAVAAVAGARLLPLLDIRRVLLLLLMLLVP